MGVANDISSNIKVLETDKNFIVDFYTRAFVFITVQWIKNSMKESPEIIVVKLNDVVERSMLGTLTIFDKYNH